LTRFVIFIDFQSENEADKNPFISRIRCTISLYGTSLKRVKIK